MRISRLAFQLFAFLLSLGLAAPLAAVEQLTALVGNDLTDPEDDGDDSTPLGSGFNAEFSASQGATFSGQGAFNVFDNKLGNADKWCCVAAFNQPAWVQADFGAGPGHRLLAFTIASGNDGPWRDPDRFRIQGSQNGVNYVNIYSYDQPGVSPFTARDQVLLYRAGVDFPPPVRFRYLRFLVESTVGDAEFQLAEIEFFDQVPGSVDISVDADCSLAAAIAAAETALPVGGCPAGSPYGDRILLDSDVVYTGADPSSSMVLGTRAAFRNITQGVELIGSIGARIHRPGHVCSDVGASRIFNVRNSGYLILRGVTLADGCAEGGGAVAVTGQASLVVEDAIFEGNTARSASRTAEGGAIFVGSLAAPQRARLSIEGGEFVDNRAIGVGDRDARGGAIYIGDEFQAFARVLRRLRMQGNQAIAGQGVVGGGAYGGALFADATIEQAQNWRAIGNQAVAGAGTAAGGRAAGGAINAPVRFASGWVVRDNIALAGGSGGGTAGEASGGGAEVSFESLASAWFSGNLAQGGDSGNQGGPAAGGGLSIRDASGSFTESTISQNQALGGNGGSSGGGAAYGGGVAQPASLTLGRNLTIAENTALSGGNADLEGGPAFGGGWLSGGDIGRISHLTVSGNLVGSTFSGRGRGLPFGGGGLHLEAEATIDNSVLSLNRVRNGDQLIDEDCRGGGGMSSLGYNRVSVPTSCDFDAASDATGGDWELTVLANFGCAVGLPDGSCLPVVGMRRTSPLLDAGSCAVSATQIDAIGRARPQDISGISNAAEGCDIGAHEPRDSDGDGAIDIDDNCPAEPNPGQEDGDGDGIGDACDTCFHRYDPQTAQILAANLPVAASNGRFVFDIDAENGGAPDLGISYALSGAGASLFTIDPESGVIELADAAALGAAGTVYALIIDATDCEGSASLPFTVTVVASELFRDGFD